LRSWPGGTGSRGWRVWGGLVREAMSIGDQCAGGRLGLNFSKLEASLQVLGKNNAS